MSFLVLQICGELYLKFITSLTVKENILRKPADTFAKKINSLRCFQTTPGPQGNTAHALLL